MKFILVREDVKIQEIESFDDFGTMRKAACVGDTYYPVEDDFCITATDMSGYSTFATYLETMVEGVEIESSEEFDTLYQMIEEFANQCSEKIHELMKKDGGTYNEQAARVADNVINTERDVILNYFKEHFLGKE